MSIDHIQLMRKVNDALGKEALKRLDDALTVDEFNELQALCASGSIGLHADGLIGFAAVVDNIWSSEGFLRE